MRHAEVGLLVDLGGAPVWSARHDMSGAGGMVLGENAWVGGTDVAKWFTKCSRYHVFDPNARALPD